MASTTETRRVNVFINGKNTGDSAAELNKRFKKLNNELKHLTPNTAAWNKKLKETKQAKRTLDDINKKIRGTNSLFGQLKKSMGAMLAVGALVELGRRAIQFGKDSVRAFRESEKAIAKVEQAIKSTGGAAGRTLEELEAQATSLQKSTLFGDEEILNDATAQLLTFTNIAGKEFDRTQKVALDLSTVLDGDLKSASIQLGKALNDPVANLSALSRSGIQFSKDQAAVIKNLAETNRLAEAQNVILLELERQYGGQAEAAAAADGGATQLANAWGDMQEALGQVIDTMFDTGEGAGFLQGMVEGLKTGLETLNVKVIAAKKYFRDWYNESADMRMGIEGLIGAARIVGKVIALNFKIMLTPIKAVIGGIKSLRHVMAGEWDEAKAEVKNVGNDFVNSFKETGESIKEVWGETMASINEASKAPALKGEGMAGFFEAARQAKADAAKKSAAIEATANEEAIKRLETLNTKLAAIREKAELELLTKDEAELERVRLKYAKLLAEAVGFTEQTLELERLRDEALQILKAGFAERDAMAKVEAQDKLDQALLSEGELEVQALNDKYEAMYALADEFGLSTEDLQRKHGKELSGLLQTQVDELADIEAKAADESIKEAEKRRQAKFAIASGFAGLMKNMLREAGGDAAENSDYMKAITLAQIAIDTASSISSLTAASSANPTNAVTFGAAGIAQFAAGIGTIFSNVMRAKNLLSAPKPSPPAYAVGGPTQSISAGGPISGGKQLAYFNEEGKEYVSPNWMYTDPSLAPVYNWLENIRQTRAFAVGGSTRGIALVNEKGPSDNIELAAAVQRLNMNLEQGIIARTSYDLEKKQQAELADIQIAATITR